MRSEDMHERVLEKIRGRFALRHKHFSRKSHGGHPESLRRLAVSAVMGGVSSGLVAEAAGVSGPTIRNWHKELESSVSPKELKLVEVQNSQFAIGVGSGESATIHFQSGLRLEIPATAVTPEFIKQLNGVVS